MVVIKSYSVMMMTTLEMIIKVVVLGGVEKWLLGSFSLIGVSWGYLLMISQMQSDCELGGGAMIQWLHLYKKTERGNNSWIEWLSQ